MRRIKRPKVDWREKLIPTENTKMAALNSAELLGLRVNSNSDRVDCCNCGQRW